MRIAIDCRWIFPKLSGIGKHTENLIKGLKNTDRRNTYLFLKEPIVSYGIFSIQNQFRLPRLLRKLDVNVYHSTNFMIPLFMRRDIKVIITIHDLIPWKYPQYTPKAKKTRLNWLYKIIMKRVVKRADMIIAVSENTAKDIKECFNASPEKIKVVYNSIDPEYFLPYNQPLSSNKIEINDYIVFVGRADPYKNLLNLIRAYAELLQKYNINNKLLIVGDEDPRYPYTRDLVKELNLGGMVIFRGYAGTKELIDIYHKAKVFVLPSYYEGFGIPVIEAMACGVPVIVSNTPALTEIVKDNALIIDPNDIDGLAEAMRKILTNKDLSNTLLQKGKQYARQFTIEKMAEETAKVYEDCFST